MGNGVSPRKNAVAAPAAANHKHNYKNLNLYNGKWGMVSVPEYAAAAPAAASIIEGWARFSPYC